jgi:hypothetical protein
MTDETQSKIYQNIDRHSNVVWINLEHVVSVVLLTTRDEPTIIRVAMSNNDMFEFMNIESELNVGSTYNMRADQFLFALNSFHNQNK